MKAHTLLSGLILACAVLPPVAAAAPFTARALPPGFNAASLRSSGNEVYFI